MQGNTVSIEELQRLAVSLVSRQMQFLIPHIPDLVVSVAVTKPNVS